MTSRAAVPPWAWPTAAILLARLAPPRRYT
jgi:hypothetical protein